MSLVTSVRDKWPTPTPQTPKLNIAEGKRQMFSMETNPTTYNLKSTKVLASAWHQSCWASSVPYTKEMHLAMTWRWAKIKTNATTSENGWLYYSILRCSCWGVSYNYTITPQALTSTALLISGAASGKYFALFSRRAASKLSNNLASP